MTGTLTPTRSCLKRRSQAPPSSLTSCSDAGTNSGSSSGSSSSRNSLCKTVSFDGEEHVYFCDPDYDRHSVPVAPKLSYEDILELKMLNINLMCPQNNKSCSLVPIGILPLLPASDSSSSGTTSPGANPPTVRTKPVLPAQSHHTSPLSKHLSAQNQRFVGLLDDDLASMASSTPPPSSPSTCDHSPVMHSRGGAPLPLIATDDEGNLIFNFSDADEMVDSSPALVNDFTRRHNKKSNDVSMELSSPVRPPLTKPNIHGPKRQCDASYDKNHHATVAPPFPVPPSQTTSQFHNNAALTLTPSFFALAPQQTAASSPLKTEISLSSTSTTTSSSPFPFAPPVPTMAGLPGLPSLPALPQKSDTSMSSGSHSAKTTPTSSTLASPTSPTAKQHQRSTSSSSSNSPTSPQATPHASPTTFVPLHAHMKSQRSSTPTQATGHPTFPGSFSTLQHSKLQQQQQGHPRSPQLAGLPSPSLVPPSPLSLYPPGVDHPTVLTSVSSANPGGFFGARRSTSVTPASHIKKSSISNATSAAVGKPTSPVIKPLKS